VPLTDQYSPDDNFDLVIVVMRKNNALDILPLLAKNTYTETFLFLMNNAAGPERFYQALGRDHVLMGFPGAAGYWEGNEIVHLKGEPGDPMGIVIGDNIAGDSARVNEIKQVLEKGRYIRVLPEPYMDAWSKYHVGLLFPAMAPAFYLCGNDRMRIARNRDAVVLAWRGIKEGVKVLRKMGYPVRPAYLKRFLFLPEPFIVHFLEKMFRNPRMEVAMTRHAAVIRDEIIQLNEEFSLLINRSGVFTPTINFLMDQFNQQAPLLTDGSRDIPLRWSEIIIPVLVMILLLLILVYIF